MTERMSKLARIRFTMSDEVRGLIREGLDSLREHGKADRVPGIYATLHHVTGAEAFGLGFDDPRKAPHGCLRRNDDEIFYMAMSSEQAARFEGKHIVLRDGYLELREQSDKRAQD